MSFAMPRRSFPLFFGTLGIALVAAWLAATPVQAQDGSQAGTRPGSSASSGAQRFEARTVEPFEAVVLRGAVDLVLRQGTQAGVTVRAGSAELSSVETRVVQRDGHPTLEIIRLQRGWTTRPNPTVTVDWVKLSALTVEGSGDVTADGVATPALKLRLQGAGDVTLKRLDTRDLAISLSGSGDVRTSGRAAALAIALAGSGDVDAGTLEADAVSVSIAGSGDVSVIAHRTLSAMIAGSGDLRYSGDPQVSSRVAGSGSVTRR